MTYLFYTLRILNSVHTFNHFVRGQGSGQGQILQIRRKFAQIRQGRAESSELDANRGRDEGRGRGRQGRGLAGEANVNLASWTLIRSNQGRGIRAN